MRLDEKRTTLGQPRSLRSKWPDERAGVVTPETLARSFIRRLRADGKSENTITRYELGMRQFLAQAEAVRYPWAPTAEHLADYLAGLREAGKARNTVRNAHVALRSWFNWMHDEGEVA